VGSRSRARARAQASESGPPGSRQRPVKSGNARPTRVSRPPADQGGSAGPGAAAGSPDPAARPAVLLVAAAALGAQALGLLAASILSGVDTGAGHSYQTSSGVALTLIGIATAAALAWLGYGVTQLRPWSRTPALMTQLFVGIIGIYLLEGHRWVWGIPALVIAIPGFVALVLPRSLRALAREPQQD
jgi:hypothetical protein